MVALKSMGHGLQSMISFMDIIALTAPLELTSSAFLSTALGRLSLSIVKEQQMIHRVYALPVKESQMIHLHRTTSSVGDNAKVSVPLTAQPCLMPLTLPLIPTLALHPLLRHRNLPMPPQCQQPRLLNPQSTCPQKRAQHKIF